MFKKLISTIGLIGNLHTEASQFHIVYDDKLTTMPLVVE